MGCSSCHYCGMKFPTEKKQHLKIFPHMPQPGSPQTETFAYLPLLPEQQRSVDSEVNRKTVVDISVSWIRPQLPRRRDRLCSPSRWLTALTHNHCLIKSTVIKWTLQDTQLKVMLTTVIKSKSPIIHTRIGNKYITRHHSEESEPVSLCLYLNLGWNNFKRKFMIT